MEEYPFGSGNPDRSESGESVLRLIPGGTFFDKLENQNAGIPLRRWIVSVATRYNEFQAQLTGRNPRIDPNGIVYCVDFDPGFTNYLPEDLEDENFCAQIYGVEFTLVNDYVVNGVRTWDPWFDVPNTNRKKPELMYYEDTDGDVVVSDPTEDDYAVYATIPPTYCDYPSPGRHNWDGDSWNLAPGFEALGRMDNVASYERCTDPPGDDDTLAKRHANRNREVEEITGRQARTHARDLAGRQSSSGGFLDPNVYKYLGCGDDDTDDNDADGDPCADDSNPCGNAATNVPTTNGANPTQDPLPASSEGGVSTSHLSKTTTSTTSTAPSPSPYVLIVWTREITVASRGESTNTWWWEGQLFDNDDINDANICDLKANPIAYSKAVGASSPAQYPTELATFSINGHSACSYEGPNTATVGSVVCDDGLTARCTAAPSASQTSSIDCTDDDSSNGVARDW